MEGVKHSKYISECILVKLIRHQENGANDGHNLTCMQDGAASPEGRVSRLLPLPLKGRPDPAIPPPVRGRAGRGVKRQRHDVRDLRRSSVTPY